jgi:hypothetical protein
MILFDAKFVLKIWTFCAKFVNFLGIWDINSSSGSNCPSLKLANRLGLLETHSEFETDFVKFSFPVTCLMPYFAETGHSHPLIT